MSVHEWSIDHESCEALVNPVSTVGLCLMSNGGVFSAPASLTVNYDLGIGSLPRASNESSRNVIPLVKNKS